jgi:hypothetical protein
MFSKYAINYPVLSIGLLLILFISPADSKSNVNNTDKSQRIDVQFPINTSSDKKTMLGQWIDHSSDALTLVYGELPVEHFITKIEFSKRDSGVVPWGEVSRNTIPEVTLVVNPKSTLNELKADWTIYHEFSHLLIPYDAGDSRWFSEGLASYYQNIIQARSGMFSETKMWQKLFEGFERGRKDTHYSHQKLNYLSDNISQNHSYMRIYWSGALYWLKADIALRGLNIGYSLDKVLHELQKCCFDRYLSAVDITKRLDKLSNSTIFTSLFTDFSGSYTLPEYIDDLNMLGVVQHAGRVELENNTENSHIRRAIFKGK